MKGILKNDVSLYRTGEKNNSFILPKGTKVFNIQQDKNQYFYIVDIEGFSGTAQIQKAYIRITK